MKALFYLLDGDTNASSYHRVLQFVPFLRRQGIQPTISRPVPPRMYDRLVERGRGGLPAKLGFYGAFLVRRSLDVQRADRFDVVVIQRDLFPFGPPLLERRLFERNPRLVYDTDDATYLRPSFTPDTVFQRLRRFDKVAEVVKHAQSVSAATEPIAAWARQFNPYVQVVPMALDLADYAAARRAPSERPNPLVLGWTGTAGGLRYLETLGPLLRQIGRKHPLIVRIVSGGSGGYPHVSLPGVTVDARPWCAETWRADVASFDIGLVPLDDSPFERAKFPMKLLHYFALGVPSVSTRLPTTADIVRHGENGFLAAAADEWQTHLENLIADVGVRRRVAAAGLETVAAHYTIERVGPLLVDVLTSASKSA